MDRIASGLLNNPSHHGSESRLIFSAHRFELQPHPHAGKNESHRGARPNLAVWHQKMHIYRAADGTRLLGLYKHAAHSQILHPRRIFRAPALPQHPHSIGRLDALVLSS